MPRDVPCNHRNCDGEPCRQLTPEELAPDEADTKLAQMLIASGWRSVSAKQRRVARMSPLRWPTSDQLIRPEMREHPAGHELVSLWEQHQANILRRYASGNRAEARYVEVRDLTVRQFRAFKLLRGLSA